MRWPLYVASASPRRALLLNHHGLSHTVIPNLLLEEKLKSPPLSLLGALRALAYEKAVASKAQYQGLILAADTIVVLDNHCLGKPRNQQEALSFLTALSGNTHEVITGVCILNTITDKYRCRTDKAKVSFSPLSPEMITAYIQDYQPFDKAGAYGIQELPEGFLREVNGSFETVMGLPVHCVKSLIQQLSH